MLDIKGKERLKYAYRLLAIMEQEAKKCPENKNLKNVVDDIKREIRQYTNKQLSTDRMIKDYGIDGMVILQQLPGDLTSIEDAIEYFEEVEKYYYRPSAYDCTGQLFTTWYKVFERNGKFFVYHSIARDV